MRCTNQYSPYLWYELGPFGGLFIGTGCSLITSLMSRYRSYRYPSVPSLSIAVLHHFRSYNEGQLGLYCLVYESIYIYSYLDNSSHTIALDMLVLWLDQLYEVGVMERINKQARFAVLSAYSKARESAVEGKPERMATAWALGLKRFYRGLYW